MTDRLTSQWLFVSLVISVATASCGNEPPSFRADEPDASGIGGDTDADSNSDADYDIDSDTDSDAEGDSNSDVDTDPGGETDSTCFDPTGHDEDGDGVLDLCDNCPTVANSSQASGGDGDDLGDACEATGRAGLLDRIALFEPFVAEGPEWKREGGDWAWLNDVVQGAAPGGTSDISAYYVHTTQLGNGAYAVETTFVHDQGGISKDWTPFAGVVFAWSKSNDTTNFWTCLYEWDTRDLSIWRTQKANIQWVVVRNTVDSSNFDATIWRRVRVTWDGVALLCEFENELGDFDSVTAPEQQIWNDMSGQAGLRIYNETSSFTSFAIYK